MSVSAEVLRSTAQRYGRRYLAHSYFLDFLRHVKVRSDDPLTPTIASWEPWPHLVQRAEAWQAGRSEVVLKARQLGYTWLEAAYLAWRARQGWACACISKGQLEARAVLERVRFVEEHLPDWLWERVVFRADDASYPGGGSVRAFPSTVDAGVSFTFQCVAFDEAAFHPYGGANYAAIRPTVSAGGQMHILSTADPELGQSGFFHKTYWAAKRGESGYDAVFVPWHARPGRDAAWLARERAAFVGLPSAFDAYYPESDAEAFVGRSGLVYPQFSVETHVPKQHPWQWEASHRKVAAVDFGGGDPTAVVMLGMSGRQHVHQFGEFYKRGPVGVDALAGYIGRWKGPGLVVCDPSEPVAIETLAQALRGTGWRAEAAENKRAEGLGFVGWLLDSKRLTIAAECVESVHEFAGYRWAQRVDPTSKDRYATSTPVDHHGDAMDARRYAVLELLGFLQGGGPLIGTLDGGPRRTVAV